MAPKHKTLQLFAVSILLTFCLHNFNSNSAATIENLKSTTSSSPTSSAQAPTLAPTNASTKPPLVAIAATRTLPSTTTTPAPTSPSQQLQGNCTPICSSAEFSVIIQRLNQNDRSLSTFLQLDGTTKSPTATDTRGARQQIRAECVRELISLIKNLAADEIEMKSLIEFASSSGPLQSTIALPLISSTSPSAQSQKQGLTSQSNCSSNRATGDRTSATTNGQNGPIDAKATTKAVASQQETSTLLVVDQESSGSEKSKVLPKVVAKVDHYIDSLERFTLTREWKSLMKVFQGVESIMSLFVSKNTTTKAIITTRESKPQANATTTLPPITTPAANVTTSYGQRIQTTKANGAYVQEVSQNVSRIQLEANQSSSKPQVIVSSPKETEVELLRLKESLPVEVQTLTGSLSNLFPWHVWPWNNIDLYTTAETFLNHGIFAFSKTTSGPERRIDHLAGMLQTLFKSMKFETFPKKCNDWSKIICDPVRFQERLVLAPPANLDDQQQNSSLTNERETQAKALASVAKNQLTGELACIMFSSLSMQQFGAQGPELLGQEEAAAWRLATDLSKQQQQLNSQQLAWDRLVHKALKLYGLAREALTDDQWGQLYKLMQSMWKEQKISDRVIMVGRIVQLLTNCHMPKEMLESALWKDIYKYKNALNQLSDIVIEQLNKSSDNGKFSIEQLALGSKHLNEILLRFSRLLPKLIESLSKTIVDQLPELVNRFFSDRIAFFQGPCKGGNSFSDLVPNLDAHRAEIMELEDLICGQLNTKPSFSMMQINNLTNELLAMAFNFSNFGPSLPGFLTNLNPVAATTQLIGLEKSSPSSGSSNNQSTNAANTTTTNVTSIVDELVANPRLGAIVAILQSSPLDPPEVHAELPELDWVEAGTSIALLYESIQRLLSVEGQIVVFPEVDNFQSELDASVSRSRKLFKKFSKRDPIRLFAYALDAAMPIAVRTFKPMDSFYGECQATLRDLFNQVPDGSTSAPSSGGAATSEEPKEARQWQCFVSSLAFGAHASNKLMGTFNSMLESVLAHAPALGAIQTTPSRPTNSNLTATGQNNSDSCLLFDGSLTKILDNWPQVMELALESVLVASTSSPDQQVALYDTICNGNYSLDPFGLVHSRSEVQATRVAMCHLASKSSLQSCAQVLKFDEWKSVMHQLNATWFESNALGIDSAFRATTLRVHEFLILFGRAKPSNWSDSLLARILNVNSFWDGLLNKTVSTVERYQERRFELGLQTLEPIIYDNLIASSTCRPISTISSTNPAESSANFSSTQPQESCSSTRDILITSIAVARAIASHFDSPQVVASTSGNQMAAAGSHSSLNEKLQTLFAIADDHSLDVAESLLTTVALNMSKLEALFETNGSTVTSNCETCSRFCTAPIDRYFELGNQSSRARMEEAKDRLCRFNWTEFHEQLVVGVESKLAGYPVRQLTRVALTKWGQTFDSILSSSRPGKKFEAKFLQIDYWQPFHAQLSLVTPLKEQPSNFIWIWQGIERILNKIDGQSSDSSSNATTTSNLLLTEALARSLDQLNCALDSVKGGLSWENLANIYSDRQEILAAHSTINNGFVLASIGVSTFMAPKKFQRLLDEFVRPIRSSQVRHLLNSTSIGSFCEMRDKSRWETILALPNEAVDFGAAIDSFQELVCDTNFETLPQSINPISVCYQPSTGSNGSSSVRVTIPLAETLDRSFKLASLAAMDAKLVAANDARPPIFDKSQWSSFWDWWSTQPAAEPRGGLALALVRAFQTLDSMNSGHVVWHVVFKSTHELAEALAYLVRAAEQRGQQQLQQVASANKTLVLQPDASNKTISKSPSIQPQQLVSTLSSLMFPEANQVIPLKTFKQLRYIKSIADYFSSTQGAQESLCRQVSSNRSSHAVDDGTTIRFMEDGDSKIELIGFKLNNINKLNLLLCRYHSSQWLTALNIVISSKTKSLMKRVNYMTKYLSIFTRQFKQYENLESFIHGRQMDNIETVANLTVSHLLAASYSLRGSLSLSKLSNVSWSSMPTLLDSIDKQLCDQSGAEFGIHNLQQLISFRSLAQLEPKKPDLETLICKLPQWNVSQIYEYLSENFDLHKMISLVTQPLQQQQHPFLNGSLTIANKLFSNSTLKLNLKLNSTLSLGRNSSQTTQQQQQPQEIKCMTPFKLASKWIKIAQETLAQVKSKSSRDKIRKCLSASTKGQSICAQSLRYIRFLNKLLSSINELTSANSWSKVRKTWGSISYHLLNQQQQQQLQQTSASQTLRQIIS